MSNVDRLSEDLDYVASAVRHRDRRAGVPAIYFLWAAITLVGFSIVDFAPRTASAYWLIAGTGGGILSWFLGERAGRRAGMRDVELGKRYGLHWLIAGVAFILCALPLIIGRGPGRLEVTNFMLVAGLAYGLAGVHLERPLLWTGLLMLAAYAAMIIAAPPYAWTIAGVVIGASLAWSGVAAARHRETPAAP